MAAICLALLLLLQPQCLYASGIGAVAADAELRYASVMNPTMKMEHLQDLPGFTRSVVDRDHSLLSVESRVYQPLPGWSLTSSAHLISPALSPSVHFSMALLRMKANATSAPPSPGVERLVFVLSGSLSLSLSSPLSSTCASSQSKEGGAGSAPSEICSSGDEQQKQQQEEHVLQADGFAYLPPHTPHSLLADRDSDIVLLERRYHPITGGALFSSSCFDKGGAKPASWPSPVIGRVDEQPIVPVGGEVFVLRKLLPTSLEFDFNIHIMDFQPGEHLNVREVHYNQHGLLLLEGRGIYRLADKWYPVQSGDAIWMAPFVPQWYAALGSDRSRYFLYKDTNRDPLAHPPCPC